jgi:glyoxylase-like metal-dependent hydrolase (beta-lactamase superfamily II)
VGCVARGHQSLLLRLPHRGSMILSGGTAHLSSSQALRRVPVTNADRVRSVASMQRIADLVASEDAELWINHDREQAQTLPKSPAWID